MNNMANFAFQWIIISHMEKVLLSWYAYNNDFIIQQSGNSKRKVGTVNEDGPSFNVHRHYWDGMGYSKHLILNNSTK